MVTVAVLLAGSGLLALAVTRLGGTARGLISGAAGAVLCRPGPPGRRGGRWRGCPAWLGGQRRLVNSAAHAVLGYWPCLFTRLGGQ